MEVELCSNISTSTLPWELYGTFIIEGSLLAVLNLLPFFLIIFTRKFREQKEYIIFAANLFMDFLAGVTHLAAGIHRLEVYLNNAHVPLLNSWTCFHTVHNYLFSYVFPGCGLISLMTAIDRFFAVVLPLKYLQMTTSYAIRMVILGYLSITPVFFVCGFASYIHRETPITATCETSSVPILNEAIRVSRIFFTLFSLVLYIPITVRFRKIMKASGVYSTMSSKQRSSLIRYNFIVILMTINELTMFVFPDVYLIVAPATSIKYVLFMMILNKGTLIILFLNLFFYRVV